MSARRLLLTAVAWTLIACAAGCGGDSNDGPSTLPASTENASPTEPTITSPVPSSADAAEAKSAEAFARDWFRALDVALAEASPEPLRQFFLPQCSLCEQNYSAVQELASAGQRIAGGGQDVQEAILEGAEGSGFLVKVVAQARPSQRVDSDGQVLEEYPGSKPAEFYVNLLRQPDGWIIQDFLALGERA